MPTKNQSHIVIYRAFNTLTGALQGGDVSNHTLLWSKDGATGVTPTNSPSARATAGFYQLTLTATEANCEVGTLIGTSSSANVILEMVVVDYSSLKTLGTTAPTSWIDANSITAAAFTGSKFATNALDASTILNTLTTRLSSARAGYLDNLNTGVPLSSSAITAIFSYVVFTGYSLTRILKGVATMLFGKGVPEENNPDSFTTEMKLPGTDTTFITIESNGMGGREDVTVGA